MGSIQLHTFKVDYPVTGSRSLDSLKAEHEATLTTYKEHMALTNPKRKEYDALYIEHDQAQKRYEKIMDIIATHRTTYQRHKRYFISLSNAVLASNTTLHSAPRPFSDSQALAHATLLHDLGPAARLLASLILRNKRLEKAREAAWEIEQELYGKCQEMFVLVERDGTELDRLHAKVREAEKKMGVKPACGAEEEKCPSCARIKEREARRRATEENTMKEKKQQKGGTGKAKKAPHVKGRLEDILEEAE